MKLNTYDLNNASFEQLLEWEKQILLDIASIESRIESFYPEDGAPEHLKQRTHKALRHNRRNLQLLQTLIGRERKERDKLDRLIAQEDLEKLRNERVEKHAKIMEDMKKAKEERVRKHDESQRQRDKLLVKELRKLVSHEDFINCCDRVEELIALSLPSE